MDLQRTVSSASISLHEQGDPDFMCNLRRDLIKDLYSRTLLLVLSCPWQLKRSLTMLHASSVQASMFIDCQVLLTRLTLEQQNMCKMCVSLCPPPFQQAGSWISTNNGNSFRRMLILTAHTSAVSHSNANGWLQLLLCWTWLMHLSPHIFRQGILSAVITV